MGCLIIYFIWEVPGDKGALALYMYGLHAVTIPGSDLDKELHTVTGQHCFTWASDRTAFAYSGGGLHPFDNSHYMYYI